MELQKFSYDLHELSTQESCDINGGESMWYWILYHLSDALHTPRLTPSQGGNATWADK
jgi:hypothetical protein